MSATDRHRSGPAAAHNPSQTRQILALRARRRQARRRRRLARLDTAIGLLAAIVLLLVSPGLAITALVAVLALALCALSATVEWLRRRR